MTPNICGALWGGQYRLAFDGADTFSLELVEEGCDVGPANGAEDSNPYERRWFSPLPPILRAHARSKRACRL
jgi:hypothetical protein